MGADHADGVLAPWPLTGRDDAVARAAAALDDHASIVVISGAPGVGKSRVVDRIGDVLAERGWLVPRVRATSIMAEVPLGALLPLFPTERTRLTDAGDPATLLARALTAVESLGPPPRLIVVDDLGLLDPLSTTLIAQLVAVGAVRVAATLRAGDPLPEPFVATWTPDRSLRIDLPPFDLDAVHRLLAQVLGGPVAHRTAGELHRASGGNPLYLRELVIGARDSGRLTPQGGVWQLTGAPVGSTALRELILARVSQLDPEERDVVDRLAVCGELRAAHLTAPGARAALGRLETAGFVEVGPRLEVRLAHPQYAPVVTAALSRLRAADLLLEQADLLDRDAVTAADALRSVTWRLAAGAEADPEILGATARLAREAGDHRTVERLTDAALAVTGDRADLLLLRGEAKLRMGRADAALEDLRAAAASAADPALDTAIAATTALAHISVHEGLADALHVLRGAEPDDRREPTLALIRALVELYSNNAAEADRVVAEVAGGFGDSSAERAIIAAARAQPLAALGRDDDAMAAATTALGFARAAGAGSIPGHSVADALHTLAVVHLHAGRIDDARDAATQALVAAIGADDEIVSRSIEFLLSRIAADAGRLETSARWCRDTMSGAMISGPMSLYIPALAGLAIVLIAHGDVDEARSLMAEVPADVGTGPGGVIAQAWLDHADGRGQDARQALLDEGARMAASGHLFLAGTMLLHAARLGGATAAAAPLAQLTASSPSPLLAVQSRHVSAEAAGDADALEAVAEEWTARGAHLLAAEAFASAARAARAGGDPRRAAGLQGRCDAAAALCEGPATPLLRFTDELTPLTRREREIAALAASGASSKEIAAKLYLSTRTVDNHLQSVYGKLGISGRRDLAQR